MLLLKIEMPQTWMSLQVSRPSEKRVEANFNVCMTIKLNLAILSLFSVHITFSVLSDNLWYLQTTYELFRYKAENRINVYDRGCANNYGQVFCAKNESSRINFRAYETEEASKPPCALIQGLLVGDTDEGRREKVEDNLEMGNDLLKISQCPDTEEVTDVRSRATDSQPQQLSEVDYALGLESHVSSSKFDRHHSNMRRKNGRRWKTGDEKGLRIQFLVFWWTFEPWKHDFQHMLDEAGWGIFGYWCGHMYKGWL